MRSPNDTIVHMQKLIKSFEELPKKLAILLIVKLKSETIIEDYTRYSVLTTYFTDKELDDLLKGFQEFADYVDICYGEKQFVQRLQSGFYDHLTGYMKIAYSEQSTGTSRSKSAIFPSICELYGVRYCSNDTFTAALLDNKMATFSIMQSCGFSLPKTWFFKYGTGWLNSAPPNNLKLIAKPAYECASIGIDDTAVGLLDDHYLNHVETLSRDLNQPVMVQEFISGYEVEVPLFDDSDAYTPCSVGISLHGNRLMDDRFLAYDTIFDDGFDLFNFDSHENGISGAIKREANQIYRLLQLKGPVRIDYRITPEGTHYIMDYNNSPTLAKLHSFAFCVQEFGFSYADMLKLVVYPTLGL